MARNLAPQTAAKFEKDLTLAVQDAALLDRMWERILNEYEDQYVAFYRGAVVAHAADVQDVQSELERLGLQDDVVHVLFVTTKPYIL